MQLKFYIHFNKKDRLRELILSLILIVLLAANAYSQCTYGNTNITWQAAASGSQTIIPTASAAGGPPAAVIDAVPGCTNTNSINPFNFTTTITEVVGTVYDAIRSGTNGLYGQPYLTVTLDNFDGGCTTCNSGNNAAYANGSRVDIRFDFQYPVLLNGLRVDDVDAADASRAPTGSSSFQDVITFSATGLSGANVPLNLALGATGRVTISGQTATANWASGVNNNVSENDPLGQVTITSTMAVKSLLISFIAGPSAISAAQQAIRISNFNLCCPVVVDLSGNVFNDCNALTDNIVNGTGLGNPSSTTLYANLVEPTSNLVIAVATVGIGGSYSMPNIPGNVTYNVVLSTTMGVVGSAPPAASLPSGWSNVGENLGTGAGNDGVANGTLSNIAVGAVDLANANFGIRNTPTCNVSNNSPVCQGGTATFTETGVNGATWSWTGPNGFTSSLRNPTIANVTSAAAGVYTVTVTNSTGCTTTCTTNLVVAPDVTVSASASPLTLCAGNSFNLNGTVTNGVLREFFPNITGSTIADLTSSSTYPNNPALTQILSTAIGPSGIADNYGTRVRYYFTPSTSGSYQFVIYGDDQTTLSWSGSSAASPLTTIANIPDWTNVNELTKYASQTTASLSLNAGTQYYFELLQKEGGGGDHYGILYRMSPSTTFINIPSAELSPAKYSWSGPNGYTSENINNTITNAQPNQSGIYTITITDFYGCQKTATVNVTINALPVPTAGSNSPVCVGQSINLTSSGGTSYVWSGPNSFSSTSQNPTRTGATLAMAGTYNVTVTNAAGCTAVATTAVTVNALPTPTAGSNSPVCVGQTINLTSSGGVSYSWAGPNGFTSTAQNPSITNASPAMNGPYTVTVTNSNGCTAIATTNVVVNGLPTVVLTSQTNILCRGNSTGAINITASGGSGIYTYDWADVAGTSNTEDRTGLPAGTYTVTVTDGNTCSSAPLAVTLTQPASLPTVVLTGQTNILCRGNSTGAINITASGGTGAFTYDWADVAGTSNTEDRTGLPAGTYTVTVTDANGCSTAPLVVTLTQPAAALTRSLAQTNVLCFGNSTGAIDLTVSGGTSPYTYAWSNAATTQDLSGLTA
ncbi:MAG TPA: hypothetical protein VK175_17995, partial [Leadbetterella sp.]|nr:hypothetical protein [Leadbetterella sp.]